MREVILLEKLKHGSLALERQVILLKKLKYESSILEESVWGNLDLILVSNLSVDLGSC